MLPEKAWAALTTAGGLAGWCGSSAEIDLRPGGRLFLRWEEHDAEGEATVEVAQPPHRFSFWWGVNGLPNALAGAGLVVQGAPAGRRHPYRLNPAPIRVALRWLSLLAHEWGGRLSKLEKTLAA